MPYCITISIIIINYVQKCIKRNHKNNRYLDDLD